MFTYYVTRWSQKELKKFCVNVTQETKYVHHCNLFEIYENYILNYKTFDGAKYT